VRSNSEGRMWEGGRGALLCTYDCHNLCVFHEENPGWEAAKRRGGIAQRRVLVEIQGIVAHRHVRRHAEHRPCRDGVRLLAGERQR